MLVALGIFFNSFFFYLVALGVFKNTVPVSEDISLAEILKSQFVSDAL